MKEKTHQKQINEISCEVREFNIKACPFVEKEGRVIYFQNKPCPYPEVVAPRITIEMVKDAFKTKFPANDPGVVKFCAYISYFWSYDYLDQQTDLEFIEFLHWSFFEFKPQYLEKYGKEKKADQASMHVL